MFAQQGHEGKLCFAQQGRRSKGIWACIASSRAAGQVIHAQEGHPGKLFVHSVWQQDSGASSVYGKVKTKGIGAI